MVQHSDILILGAGLAGTCLAARLERAGFGGRVVLLDGRQNFDFEARWCFWQSADDEDDLDLRSLVRRSWGAWQVRDEARVAVQSSARFRYAEVEARAFYRHFHASWGEGEQRQLWRGARVDAVREDEHGVTVETSRGAFRAPLVFDARHRGASPNPARQAGQLRLVQDFVGWIVETERPVFEPERATLMDFRLRQTNDGEDASGVRFAYVLPHSPTQALVESTHFGQTPKSRAAHEHALRRYLLEVLDCSSFRIEGQETGVLPMDSAPFAPRPSARVWNIGVVGGAARPSSGYAFARIQKQTRRLARALMTGEALDGDASLYAPLSLQERLRAFKYGWLDATFLDVLKSSPAQSERCFVDLFARVAPDALVRFLDERSSALDDAQIIAALPKPLFFKAALRRVRARLARSPRAAFPEDAPACVSNVQPAHVL